MTRSEFSAGVCAVLAPRFGSDDKSLAGLYEHVEAIADKHAELYGPFDPGNFEYSPSNLEHTSTVDLPVDFPSGIASFSPGDGEVKVSIHDDWVEGKEWAAKQKMDGPGDFDAVFDKMANREVVQFTDKARAGAYAYISSRATELLRQKSLAADVGMDIMGARAQSEGMELPTMLVVGADVDAFQLNIPMKESVRIQRGEYKIVLHRL